MLISDAVARAASQVSASERDVLRVFTPSPPAIENGAVSVVAPPDAYFIVADDRGRLLFTKDGAFALRAGTLKDSAGRSVMGFAGAQSPLEPLRMDSIDTALGFASGVRADASGSLIYTRAAIDPRTGAETFQSVTFGRLALARFAPATKLRPVDAAHFAAPDGAVPHVGSAGDGNFALLSPPSGVTDSAELTRHLERMQEAYLALDAVRAATKAQDASQKTAMDLLK